MVLVARERDREKMRSRNMVVYTERKKVGMRKRNGRVMVIEDGN